MDFMSSLEQTLNNGASNRSVTENGAVGYRTTGRKLLDLNFAVASLRKVSDTEIQNRFAAACAENVNDAIVWLFFARDIRGGMGERRLFRVCMKYLAEEFPSKVQAVLPLIAEYGRWDDVVCLMETELNHDVVKLICDQLTEDMENAKNGKGISLLAKWMPSENASSASSKRSARMLANALNVTPPQYRKMLSALRRKIDVIERKMSANEWEAISYPAVPSRANLLYNSAFLRHDEQRRREFLSKLSKGETKINSSAVFPHDIVHKYNCFNYYGGSFSNPDKALEGMWKALPNTVKSDEGTIVVADGSGSMYSSVDSKSGVKAIEVANALAIYFAERLSGPYKDKYITFSRRPQIVNLAGASTLLGKLRIAKGHNEVANTNVEAVFDLILDTAVKNRLHQEDIPKNILIISDMEFDGCAECGNGRYMSRTLFDAIATKYARYGYKLPRLVFWNVNSRTGTIPVKENDMGVALVSGFSPAVAKIVMSGQTDPMDALMETLNSERYAPVRKALE